MFASTEGKGAKLIDFLQSVESQWFMAKMNKQKNPQNLIFSKKRNEMKIHLMLCSILLLITSLSFKYVQMTAK